MLRSCYHEDEVPDSEDEVQAALPAAAPNEDSSAIGAFSTPSLPAKSGGFITIASESISEFTTSNPRDLPSLSGRDRVPTDISNFTTTTSSNRLPTPSAISAISNKSSTSMLPRNLLSPASLPLNTARLPGSPPRPKPRNTPRLNDSARSLIKTTPHSMPLSPPSTEHIIQTVPRANTIPPSTPATALGSAGGPSHGADKHPPVSLHSSSADKAPPLIDISSSEDERSAKLAGKRKLRLITDDECEPCDLLDRILSPAASKLKQKKSKRIETDDEFEVDDEHLGVELDLRISKKSKQKSKKSPRPTILSDRDEGDDELDLIGAAVALKTKTKTKTRRKPPKPRASKSNKGQAEFMSSEFIDNSDREDVVLSECPHEDSVHHTRHVIAEVVVPPVALPNADAPLASAFDNPPRDAATTSNVPPHSNSSSAHCPQGVPSPSPTDKLHMPKPMKRNTPEIQDDDNNGSDLRRTSPASLATKKKKKKRKIAVALEDGGEPKSRKRRKSKSDTSTPALAVQGNSDSADEQDPQQDTGYFKHPSAPSKAEDTPPPSSRKWRESGSRSKEGKIFFSEDDAEDARSANQRTSDWGAPVGVSDVVDESHSDTNRATRETKANARDVAEADDRHRIDSEVKPEKEKNVKSKKSTRERADSPDKATPALAASTVASVENNDASNIPRAISDAPTSQKLAVQLRRKSEPVYPIGYDKSREASTIAEILLKTGLKAPQSAIKPRQGLSRTHRIASLHSRIRTPPPRPPPIPKAKKAKKDDYDQYDSEEEYELEGLTAKEKKKRREEKRNRLLYSP